MTVTDFCIIFLTVGYVISIAINATHRTMISELRAQVEKLAEHQGSVLKIVDNLCADSEKVKREISAARYHP